MGSVDISRRHWVTKFESGFCGTGRMMKIWRQRVIDNCPRCGAANEDTSHILQCTSASEQTVGKKAMQKLEDWLVQKKTCPDLRKLLLHMINRWRSGLMVYNHVPCEFEWY